MNKVNLLFSWLLLCGFCMPVSQIYAQGPTQAPGSKPPNVVIIVVDDLRPVLGAYGDPIAHTPNIDQLAARSVVYDNAFAVVPVCGASRASLLSGRKPTTSRFLTYNTRLDQDLPDAPSLPGYFRQHGYVTRGLGKVFDATEDSVQGWSEGVWNPGPHWHSSVARDARHNDLQKAYLSPLSESLGPATERLDVADDAYPDGQVMQQAITDLKRLYTGDSPFLLAVGLRKPHLPFTAPERYWQRYDGIALPMPVSFARTSGLPQLALHNSPELRRQYAGIAAQGLLRAGDAQTLLHGYYASVSYIDALIGQLLGAIRDLPEPPVILLLSDHGWNLGEHTLWTKHSLFDVTLKIPMMLQAPGLTPTRQNGVVDLLDVFPTLAAAAGLPVPDTLDGTNLLQTAQGKAANIARWFDGQSVRTAQFRYTQWLTESGQLRQHMLFDVQRDPDELHNLISDPTYASVITDLQQRLHSDNSDQPWAPYLRQMVKLRDAASGE